MDTKLVYPFDKKRERKWQKIEHRKSRKLVLRYYGGDPPKCSCCGEQIEEFLGIDHIGGHSNSIARRSNGHGCDYIKVVRLNYPEGLRVLCHNCNLSIGFYGHCPHEQLRELNDLLSNKIPELLNADSKSV